MRCASAAIQNARIDVEALYREHRQLLLFVAIRKFRVPADEAEALLHDVFISFISCGSEVRDRRTWLVAAICNASRAYLRRRVHEENIDEAADALAAQDVDRLDRILQVRQAISALPARDRELLRLRYFDGLSAAEIAGRLRLASIGYTHKVMSNALTRVRAAYRGELRCGTGAKARRRPPSLPTRLHHFFAANGLLADVIAREASLATDQLRRILNGRSVASTAKMIRILQAVRKTTGRFVRLSDLFESAHAPVHSELTTSALGVT